MADETKKSKPTRVTRTGRVILGPADWQKLRRELWEKQDGQCAGAIIEGASIPCGRFVPFGSNWHAAHVKSRGMGGGKRDDRSEGRHRNVRGLCAWCHINETEAQDRLAWSRKDWR